MGNIIILIASVLVVMMLVPVVLQTVKLFKGRKSVTKTLLEQTYKTFQICFVLIIIISFLGILFYKMEIWNISNFFTMFLSVLLEIIVKTWPLILILYLFKRKIKNF